MPWPTLCLKLKKDKKLNALFFGDGSFTKQSAAKVISSTVRARQPAKLLSQKEIMQQYAVDPQKASGLRQTTWKDQGCCSGIVARGVSPPAPQVD